MYPLPFRYGTRPPRGPCAPELEITVRSPDDDTAQEAIQALVDTGAIATAVPLSMIERIGREKFIAEPVTVRLADGKASQRTAYWVSLSLGNHSYRILAVAMEKEYVLLGRDVLNNYYLHLDGPNQVWGVDPSCFAE